MIHIKLSICDFAYKDIFLYSIDKLVDEKINVANARNEKYNLQGKIFRVLS